MIDRARSDFTVPAVQPQSGNQGAAAADALGRVGQAARQTGAVFKREVDRKQLADDSAALLDVENSYRLALQEIETAAQDEAPASGDGYLLSVRRAREAAQKDVLGRVPTYASQEARQQAGLLIKRLDGDSDMRATQWQDGAAKSYAINGFEASLSTSIESVLADPAQAEAERERAALRLTSIAGRLDPAEEEQLRRRVDGELAASAVQGLTNANSFTEAKEALKTYTTSLSGDQQRALTNYISQGEDRAEQESYEAFSLGIAEGEVTKEDLTAARKSGDIKDDGYYRALLGQAEQKTRNDEIRAKQAEAEAQAARFATLRVGIDDGNMTRADVENAYKRGKISPSQWSQLALQANTAAAAGKTAATFAEHINLGIPIDPRDTDMKKGAEALFQKNGGKNVFVEDWGKGVALTQQFAEAGLIPETPVTVLRGMKSSGTPEQQMASIDTISKLYTDYPNAVDAAFTASEVAEAISFADKLDAGIEPQVAFEAIKLEREARNEPAGATSQTRARVAEARKLSADFKRSDAIKDADTGSWTFDKFSGGVLAEEQIITDFQQAFQTYYVQHGDEKLARKQARATLARTVGKSRANGGRIMTHPPERYYPDTGNKDWMRDALTAGVTEAMGAEVDFDQIELISDTVTAREARDGQVPTYAVKVKTGGAEQVLPQRWSFDAEAASQMAEERRVAEEMAGKDKAAQKRARRAEQVAEWARPRTDSVAWSAMSESERAAAQEAYEHALADAAAAKKAAGLD